MGEERLWQGDKKFWDGSSPILFPVCSGLKNGEYYFEGQKYAIEKHGFLRFCQFTTENVSENSATFLFSSNEKTKVNYPFDFQFRATFTLKEKSLEVSYAVKNLSTAPMYFSLGSHEGYFCPEGIEDYDIIFSEKETLDTYKINADGLIDGKENILKENDILPLKYDYFAEDALIFKELKSRSVVLKNRNTKKSIKLNFDGFDYFLIWTVAGAPFICLEPWRGITDDKDTDQNFKTKEGIITLDGLDTSISAHTIEIID